MLKANGNAHLKTSATGISQNSTAIYGSFSSLLIVKKSPHLIWGKDFATLWKGLEEIELLRVQAQSREQN